MNKYEKKRLYIQSVSNVFSVLKEVGGINYAHMYSNDKEYVRIKNAYGNTTFLDVTGRDSEAILTDIVMVMIGKKPESVVGDKETRKLAENYFNEKGWMYD